MATNEPVQITNNTHVQLTLLKEISVTLGQANLPFWLRGGWAIDFLGGHITRSHSDIDLVAWKCDSAQIKRILTQAGFLFERDIGIQMDFSKSRQEISVVFIAKNQAGQIYTPDIPAWTWHPDSLSIPPHQLSGLTCQILSPQQLLAEKESYEEGTGRPLRPKDLQSIEILKSYMRKSMLQDKVIIITGASGGIGMEIARALAAEGARLLLTARRQAKLEAIQSELTATGADVAIFSGDVTVETDCRAIAQAAVDAFGQIDVLINNAGYGPPGSLQETTEALWDATINSCLKSVYLMTRAVTPRMLQNGGGTVLQISLMAGKSGVPNRTAYCAAKWGVEGFTAALRAELSEQGIRVYSVNPGPVATPWWETAGNAQSQEVLDRMVQPEDVAETVRWLLTQAEKVRIDEILVQPRQNPGIQR